MGSETNMIEAATTNEITMHMTAVAVPRAVACSGVTSPLRGTRRPLKGLVASIPLNSISSQAPGYEVELESRPSRPRFFLQSFPTLLSPPLWALFSLLRHKWRFAPHYFDASYLETPARIESRTNHHQ